MRFISTDARRVTIAELDAALKQIVPMGNVRLAPPGEMYAEVDVNGEVHAELEINIPGDDIFKEELDELREPVEWYSETPEKARVLHTLDHAQWIACFSLLKAGWKSNYVDRLCDWLLEHYAGLLEIDGEGYFDRENIVLEF
jgi:hypothetical protein